MTNKTKLPFLPPSIRLFLNGPDKEKSVPIADYLLNQSVAFSVTEKFVRKLAQFCRADYTDFPSIQEEFEELPQDFLMKGQMILNRLKEDFETHSKNKEAYDKATHEESERQRLERQKARDEDERAKEAGKALFEEKLALSQQTVAPAIQTVDGAILSLLGNAFKIDEETGLVSIDSKTSESEFAHVLGGLSNMARGTGDIARRATELESSVAYNYSKRFPLTWKNLYIGREEEMKRIQPGKKTLESLEELGEKPCGPLWLLRHLATIKVDEKGTKAYYQARRDGLKLFRKFKEDNGRNPTQREVKEIVDQVKTSYGIVAKVKPSATMIMLDEEGGIDVTHLFKGDLEEQPISNYIAIADVLWDKDGNIFQRDHKGVMSLRRPEPMNKKKREHLAYLMSQVGTESIDTIIEKVSSERAWEEPTETVQADFEEEESDDSSQDEATPVQVELVNDDEEQEPDEVEYEEE